MSNGHERYPLVTTPAAILHALRWNAVVRTTGQLGTWLITIFVMRLLSPVDYGLMGLATILLGFFGLINELGAIPAIIQRQQVEQCLIRKVFGLVLVSNASLYVAAFAGAPYFAALFGEAYLALATVIRVLALSLIIGALSAIPNALLQRDFKFKTISLIDFAATLVGAVATLMLAFEGRGVWSLVFGSLVKEAGNAVGLMAVTRFRVAPLLDFTGLRTVLAFGMKISGARIVWYFNSSFDGLVIGKILGERALGLYSVANTLAYIPASKVLGLSNQIAFAAYSRLQDNRVRVRQYFLEGASIASFIFFPLCWGMSAVADDFVDVVLGPTWHEAAMVLQIIALGVPYRALGLFMQPLVDGLGEPGIGLKNTLTISLIVPGAAVAGLYWGLIGLCVASVAGIVMAVTINLRRNLALLDAGYGQLLSAFFPSMLAAGIMYAAVLGANAMLAHAIPVLWRLPTVVVFGAFIYGAATVSFNRQPATRCLQLIKAVS
jgi:O-antigen/teichoic acid export membrane protein